MSIYRPVKKRPLGGDCELRGATVHEAHDWDLPSGHVHEDWYYYHCAGWHNTHTVTVRDAAGKVIYEAAVDLSHAKPGEAYANRSMDELAVLSEDETMDEKTFFGKLALLAAAPDFCPYDSEHCREHLYDMRHPDEAEED